MIYLYLISIRGRVAEENATKFEMVFHLILAYQCVKFVACFKHKPFRQECDCIRVEMFYGTIIVAMNKFLFFAIVQNYTSAATIN